MGQVIYYVVGNKKLDSGNGIFVKDLEEMKKKLIESRPNGSWQLVISMHGNEGLLATVGGNLKNPKAAGVYNADAIRKLFDEDKQFADWRRDYGPTRTFLNACQVNMQFESVIFKALNRPGGAQGATGLGKGCRPDTFIEVYKDYRGKKVKLRSDWDALSAEDKKKFIAEYKDLNRTHGYFWQSVPDDDAHLLHYYFDEPPYGGWPKITVTINHVKPKPEISYMTRRIDHEL